MNVEVHLDRNSVAAGDDTVGHALTVSMPPETTLDQVVRGDYPNGTLFLALAGRTTPWVICVGEDGPAIGVWTEEWGQCRLADPSRNTVGALATDGRLDLEFHYNVSFESDVLLAYLESGYTSIRSINAAIAEEKKETEIRTVNERASATSARLFPPQAIAVLERVGATVLAHSDAALYLRAADRSYEAHADDRDGPMIAVTAPKNVNANYWWMLLSHSDDVARLLLGAIGEHAREVAGLEPYPWPAHELPLDDSTDRWNGKAHWVGEGRPFHPGSRKRHADFGHGPSAPEPFARIVLLPLEQIAAAYAVGGQS